MSSQPLNIQNIAAFSNGTCATTSEVIPVTSLSANLGKLVCKLATVGVLHTFNDDYILAV